MYGADARRRQTFDPGAPGFAGLADTGEQPEETVLAADEARRVHMFIDELDEAERALLKLRLDLGLDPPEIRERLGLTDRQYRRTAERAGKSLLAQFRAFDRGEWARGKRSLLCACVMGIASEAQRERAQRLIDEDPCCRAMMSELRELGGNAAALLPLPATTVTVAVGPRRAGRPRRRDARRLQGRRRRPRLPRRQRADGRRGAKDRSLTTLSNVKRQAGETLMGAKQHATSTYVRVSDPTPLTGARPGAAAAIVASCVAAGGGAYCAVEGVPESLRAPVGLDRSQADTKPAPAPADSAPEDKPSPTPAPPVLPADPPAQPSSSPPATPAPTDPAPQPVPPAPPPPAVSARTSSSRRRRRRPRRRPPPRRLPARRPRRRRPRAGGARSSPTIEPT